MRLRHVVRCLRWWSLIGLVAWACAFHPAPAAAQSAPSGPLSLSDAMDLALKNYPSIREARARAQAVEEGIDVARAAYLPRLDLIFQENRATTNNVFGVLFPQSTIFSMTGPVLGTRSLSHTVWGSAGGMLLSWEAVDFGQRKALVDAARSQTVYARNQAAVTELDVVSAAADAFLTVLAADESVRAARANVDRLQVFSNTVRTLVDNQLRPGADRSRADAELAVANNQLSQAVQLDEAARATLAEAIGSPGASFELSEGALATAPPATVAPMDATTHPAARAELAAIEVVEARQRQLDRAYYPRITLQSTLAARGTGAEAPGVVSFGNGLWPQVPNWAFGATMTFPAFDLFSINARKRVEEQNRVAERARYDRTIQALTTQDVKARSLMKAATDIARNTPIERQAASAGESQARARYQSGLASVIEVAEAQRLLAQAEADDAIARLGVWRALLAAAHARGDLAPFIEQVRR